MAADSTIGAIILCTCDVCNERIAEKYIDDRYDIILAHGRRYSYGGWCCDRCWRERAKEIAEDFKIDWTDVEYRYL